MTLASSDVATRRVSQRAVRSRARSRWVPRWFQRQREDRELARWVAELGWQWSEAVEGARLTRHTSTAAKIPLTLTPQVHSVEQGPPVTLLVRMLPGQIPDDFQNQAHRIAASMGVPAVDVVPYDLGWIKVALLERDPRA